MKLKILNGSAKDKRALDEIMPRLQILRSGGVQHDFSGGLPRCRPDRVTLKGNRRLVEKAVYLLSQVEWALLSDEDDFRTPQYKMS
jgi:hypothetical protein